ncbi:ImmA/IrrE family metallo-endopeptidase [Desulfovirgula thermocuniculi]|uniref:ImmA/IrrE family metallo-endopeptidase n=1 Tax=Desulfovirgula thermocuniculi TaxID=348842 RepID=UPI00041D101F|nr:ImmA/IrrE family metallo-endopeptidase [Desulfovirgula thermocuniculi]
MLLDFVSGRVEEVIRRYGLLSPADLARELGVVPVKLPLRSAHGISFSVDGKRVVFVDASLPPARQDGALVHEVGHQVFHPGEVRFRLRRLHCGVSWRREAEVNLFALLYLLAWNRELFEACGYNLYAFAEAHGVPLGAAEYLVGAARLRGPGFLRELGVEVPGYEGDVA